MTIQDEIDSNMVNEIAPRRVPDGLRNRRVPPAPTLVFVQGMQFANFYALPQWPRCSSSRQTSSAVHVCALRHVNMAVFIDASVKNMHEYELRSP